MSKNYKRTGFLLACNFFYYVTLAQPITNDSILLKTAIYNTIALHKAGIAENLRLYNGTEYTGSYSGTKGFPYFSTDSLRPGNIQYDGSDYQEVPMLFDLVTGEVIITSFKQEHYIKLLRDKITRFDLLGHTFIRVDTDSTTGINSGFYDLLYNNKSAVLIKREKVLRQVARSEGIDARFAEYDYYFIKRAGTYFHVFNMSSLLEAFPGKKNELRSYLRQNHLNFKKDPENTMVKSAAFYDQLTR
jgi:hypothetical protein